MAVIAIWNGLNETKSSFFRDILLLSLLVVGASKTTIQPRTALTMPTCSNKFGQPYPFSNALRTVGRASNFCRLHKLTGDGSRCTMPCGGAGKRAILFLKRFQQRKS